MSLRLRLLLAIGAVAIVALVGADLATYSALRSFLVGRVDQGLQSAQQALEVGGGSGRPTGNAGPAEPPGGSPPGRLPGGPGSSEEGPGQSALMRAAPGTFVEVRAANGSVVYEQPAYEPGGRALTPRLPGHITGYSSRVGPTGELAAYFDAPSATNGGPSFRVQACRLANGEILVLAAPLSGVTGTLGSLATIELAVTGGALVLAALLGWWLVRLGLRPLVAIERTAGDIARGELGQRVPGESPRTEVGQLAGALNVMLGRIQGAFAARDAKEAELRRSEERMRQFVADASHELRTPLAAVSAYAELFGRGADRRPDDLARVMAGIRTEAGRMGQLVGDLMTLAHLDDGRPLEQSPVELVSLSAEAVGAARAVGPAWPVRLEAAEPVEVTGDRARLRQVLDNLLSNVRAHTPRATSATVIVGRDGDQAVWRVEDDGPGIPPEHAGQLFERFYRADTSRSRAATDGRDHPGGTSGAGAGLGLSIVSALVTAHGGTISVGERPGGGASFTVRLLLTPA